MVSGMNEKEVNELLKKNNRTWKEFEDFMFGQTVGMGKDGETDYYECDVYNFFKPKHTQFFD